MSVESFLRHPEPGLSISRGIGTFLNGDQLNYGRSIYKKRGPINSGEEVPQFIPIWGPSLSLRPSLPSPYLDIGNYCTFTINREGTYSSDFVDALSPSFFFLPVLQ